MIGNPSRLKEIILNKINYLFVHHSDEYFILLRKLENYQRQLVNFCRYNFYLPNNLNKSKLNKKTDITPLKKNLDVVLNSTNRTIQKIIKFQTQLKNLRFGEKRMALFILKSKGFILDLNLQKKIIGYLF